MAMDHPQALPGLDVWTSVLLTKSSAGRGGSGKLEAYGIKKLRELILELAVRGKLVPQDPSDEPASELLEQAAVDKALMVSTGKIRKEKDFPAIADDEIPFNLPIGWEWARINDTGHDWGQKTPDADFTYIDVSAIDNSQGVISGPSVLSASEAPSRARKVVKRGTVIYSTVRPYLKNICVIEEDYSPEPIASTAFAVLHPFQGMPGKFFALYFRSPEFVKYVESVQTGIAYPAINDKQFYGGLVPVPPLAEQHRIAAKVEELLALCDQLEQQQTDSLAAHQTLVETLLGTLTRVESQQEFSATWARIASHFDTLFTTEASIDQLKQTLLQLAVMGKLVPQDPSDEPASGKLRDFVEFLNGYAFKSEWFEKSGIRLLRNANVAHGRCYWEDAAYLPPDRQHEFQKFSLAAGDLVLSLDRPIINTGLKIARITESDLPCLLLQRVAKVSPISGAVNLDYLYLWFNSPQFMSSIDPGRSNGIPHISTKQVGEIPFVRYSLAEQHRIVAKVGQLMALCDTLKARLADAQTTQLHLADAIVEQAVC